MKYKKLVILLIIIFFSFSCGKKSSLERYEESDYPRSYPAN
ncbi:hypothetical protein OA848_00105 [Rickettsiales bacterium]|nr:hypothetical protein [Rickettsiales bacterium]